MRHQWKETENPKLALSFLSQSHKPDPELLRTQARAFSLNSRRRWISTRPSISWMTSKLIKLAQLFPITRESRSHNLLWSLRLPLLSRMKQPEKKEIKLKNFQRMMTNSLRCQASNQLLPRSVPCLGELTSQLSKLSFWKKKKLDSSSRRNSRTSRRSAARLPANSVKCKRRKPNLNKNSELN
jgi:hypothetical protein